MKPLNALAHGFFDDLKVAGALRRRRTAGGALPPLFDFTQLELAACPGLAALRPPPAAAAAVISRPSTADPGSTTRMLA